MRFTQLGLTLLSVALVACGSGVNKTDCNDWIDNDGDGLFDDSDPGCAFTDNVTEAPDPLECNDSVDNDGDGMVDLTDCGCADSSDDREMDDPSACNNGTDDDG